MQLNLKKEDIYFNGFKFLFSGTHFSLTNFSLPKPLTTLTFDQRKKMEKDKERCGYKRNMVFSTCQSLLSTSSLLFFYLPFLIHLLSFSLCLLPNSHDLHAPETSNLPNCSFRIARDSIACGGNHVTMG